MHKKNIREGRGEKKHSELLTPEWGGQSPHSVSKVQNISTHGHLIMYLKGLPPWWVNLLTLGHVNAT